MGLYLKETWQVEGRQADEDYSIKCIGQDHAIEAGHSAYILKLYLTQTHGIIETKHYLLYNSIHQDLQQYYLIGY